MYKKSVFYVCLSDLNKNVSLKYFFIIILILRVMFQNIFHVWHFKAKGDTFSSDKLNLDKSLVDILQDSYNIMRNQIF